MNVLRTMGLTLLFFIGSLIVTLGVAAQLPGIPRAHLPLIGRLLALVGGSGGLVALLLLRLTRINQVGIRWQIIGASLLGSLLLVGLLFVGTEQMLITPHDHDVVLTLLVFATLVSIGFSLLWAAPLARRIERVRAGTKQLATANFDALLTVDGQDEIGQLAADFNGMAVALKQAAAHERELEQARRDLIAAVSHDLRTPLAAVRALIEALSDGVVANPQTEARYLRSAHHEITHLSQLVDDLFELAQIDAGVLRLELERASLHDLISDTLASFQPQAERLGVRLVGEVMGEIDPVLMSPPKVQRVLHNLLGNALRHTPADGTILVRAQHQDGGVQVEVTDTGEGIPVEDLPHIFERTFRGEKSRTRVSIEGSAGAGLGLAIAHGLIAAHGSTIHVESQVGKGARFCFTLQRG
ncbi:MAG: ATP-binding protein [Chloroflexota bacterium]|nr:ATP-binding protein [Chloroflexota bacterium]